MSPNFFQSVSDSIHKGVLGQISVLLNNEHNLFVGETLITRIKEYIIWVRASSIETYFIIFGNKYSTWKSSFDITKLSKHFARGTKYNLVFLIDTVLVYVELPFQKQQKRVKYLGRA